MMNQTENEFFDTYKRVDRICADMYSADNGITEYITQMESKSGRGRYKVSGWEDSYRTLKHLRWMRNQLAHEINSEECTEEDLSDLNDFYRQIMSQQDPLAMLYKAERPAQRRVSVDKATITNQNVMRNHTTPLHSKKESSKKHVVLILLAVIAFIVLIVLLMLKM